MMKYKLKKIRPELIFNPILFWDVEDIDIKKNAEFIIARILDYGDEKDIKWLRSVYSDESIIKVIKKRRGLFPQTAKFWAIYFKIPIEDVECLKMYCQKKQLK